MHLLKEINHTNYGENWTRPQLMIRICIVIDINQLSSLHYSVSLILLQFDKISQFGLIVYTSFVKNNNPGKSS